MSAVKVGEGEKPGISGLPNYGAHSFSWVAGTESSRVGMPYLMR